MTNSTSAQDGSLRAIVLGGSFVCGAAVLSAASIIAVLSYMIYQNISRRFNHIPANYNMLAYLISFLATDFLKALSFVMSIKWLKNRGVVVSGSYCDAQAVISLLGKVGSAVWTMTLAFHIFNLLFLRLNPSRWSMPAVLCAVWGLLFTDLIIGPVLIMKMFPNSMADQEMPPESFFAEYQPHTSLCGISARYAKARVYLEYLPIGISVLVSTFLMGCVVLRLRGNLYVTGGRWKLRLVNREDAWHEKMLRAEIESRILLIAKRLTWFPVSSLLIGFPVLVVVLMQAVHPSMMESWGLEVLTSVIFALAGCIDGGIFYIIAKIMPDFTVVRLYATHDSPSVAPKALEAKADVPKLVRYPSFDSKPYPARPHRPADSVIPEFAPFTNTRSLQPTRSFSSSNFRQASSYGYGYEESVRSPAPAMLGYPDQRHHMHSPPAAANFLSMGSPYPSMILSRSNSVIQSPPAKAHPDNFVSPDTTGSFFDRDEREFPQYQIASGYARESFLDDSDEVGSQGSRVEEHNGNRGHTRRSGFSEATVSSLAVTPKAKVYGARFSLVGGPMPAYNYDITAEDFKKIRR